MADGLVMDSSSALALLLPDEAAPAPDIPAMIASGQVHAPAHWLIESLNGLVLAERRGRIPLALRDRLIGHVAGWPVRRESAPGGEMAMRIASLATRRQLTAYDAAYLELAARLALPLATFDAALARAAAAEGVVVH
jgi:predicted nucleic acid-binding protein